MNGSEESEMQTYRVPVYAVVTVEVEAESEMRAKSEARKKANLGDGSAFTDDEIEEVTDDAE